MKKQYTKEQFYKEFKSLSQLSDRYLADSLSIEFYLEAPIQIKEDGLFGNLDVFNYQGYRLGSLKESDKI